VYDVSFAALFAAYFQYGLKQPQCSSKPTNNMECLYYVKPCYGKIKILEQNMSQIGLSFTKYCMNHIGFSFTMYDMNNLSSFHVRWVPVTTAWRVLGLRIEEQPRAMDGSCEYIEKAAMDKRQEMVLQLGGWAWD
jgi:hypothetical protein